jgi:hypothetical protein
MPPVKISVSEINWKAWNTREMHEGFWSGNMKDRYNLKDLSEDDRAIM